MTRGNSLAAAAVVVLTAALTFISLAPADAATWAPAEQATVHPGVQTFTNGAQCTANFVFTSGTTVYIGQAAHCASLGSNTDVNGCSTASLPLGTSVEVLGATRPGTLVYSSWLAMQAAGETDPDACAYNDIGIVQLDPADAARVNPSVPHWGGPVGLNTTGTAAGDTVYSYGNSILRLGVTLLSPKVGFSNGDLGGGWSHDVTTVSPGVPGDSGSAFLDANGNALGVLSTLGVSVPGGISNNVSDLGRMLTYLRSHVAPSSSLASIQLALGTQPFAGGSVPLDTEHPVGDPVGGLTHFLGG